jgi:hypothetical protein
MQASDREEYNYRVGSCQTIFDSGFSLELSGRSPAPAELKDVGIERARDFESQARIAHAQKYNFRAN